MPILLFLFLPFYLFATPFVAGKLEGQLGNQFFIIAATYSLARDHGAIPIFPDLDMQRNFNIPINREKIFPHLQAVLPCPIQSLYHEPYYHHAAIPYSPNMKIEGFYQSEKYFAHHKSEIMALFAPSSEIFAYLSDKYFKLLAHPYTVSIHIRFYHEDPEQKCHLAPQKSYVEKALALFPEEALFVVFSNQMEKCKLFLSEINRPLIFIEGEPYYHDLYLMSLCKHNIIANSSFSWWAAYLNPNHNKKVIAPSAWYNPSYGLNTKDLLPDDWIKIP